MFSNTAPKGKAVVERFVATGGSTPWATGSAVKPKICEGIVNRNGQPTHPERNAQAADLHLPSKDDPQQMHYRHDEKQRGSDHHVGFSVQ